MDKLVVRMPFSEGDVLVRMKDIYEDICTVNGTFKFVRMPKKEALLFKRRGIPYLIEGDNGVEDVVKAFIMAIIDPSKMPQDSYLPDEAVVNQTGCTLVKKDEQNYSITADFSKLEKYVLNYEDYASLGEQYWLALGVSTGEESILGMHVNGVELTDTDVHEAELNGIGEGGFVYWVALNENSTNHLMLEHDGKSTVIDIMIMGEND